MSQLRQKLGRGKKPRGDFALLTFLLIKYKRFATHLHSISRTLVGDISSQTFSYRGVISVAATLKYTSTLELNGF